MKFNLPKIPKIVLLLPLSLMVASCETNFENIEKFGSRSALVREKSASMAEDVYQSCLRKAKYTIPDNENNRDSFVRSLRILERQDPNLQAEEDKCQQDPYQKAVEEIEDANSVLIEYMIALGKLASDDAVSFEQNLAKLEVSLQNLNTTLASVTAISSDTTSMFQEEEINAGLAIARFVFNQLVTKFRQDNLQEAIVCTNQSIQDYIPGLISITRDFYIDGILRSEELENYQYHSNFVQYTVPDGKSVNVSTQGQKFENLSTQEQTNQILALYIFKQEYLTAVNTIEEKKVAANAYVKILEETAEAHQKLFEELNEPAIDEKEIEVSCQEYFAEIKNDVSPQTSTLTLQQLKKVDRIVMEYTNEIEPHIKKLDKAF